MGSRPHWELRLAGFSLVILINAVTFCRRKLWQFLGHDAWHQTPWRPRAGCAQSEEVVEAELTKLCSTAFNGIFRLLATFSTVFAILPLITLLTSWTVVPPMSEGQDYICISCMVVFSSIHAFPWTASVRLLAASVAGLFLAMAAFVVVSDASVTSHRIYDTAWLLVRFGASLLSPSFFVTIAGNLCASAAYCRSLHRHGPVSSTAVINELVLCVFGLQLTRLFSAALRSHVNNLVAIRTLSGEALASRALLDVVCDAVLELDGELCVDGDSPRFKAMLALMPQSSQSGKALASFLCPKERSRVESHFRGVSVNESNFEPGVLNTTLVDGRGCNIQVEVFYVCFKDLAQRVRFVLGLREIADFSEAVTMLEERQPQVESQPGTHPEEGVRKKHAHSTPLKLKTRARAGSGRSSSGSSRSSGSRRSSRSRLEIMNAKLPLTMTWAQEVSILQALEKWNCKWDPDRCCRYHCAATIAYLMCRRMRALPCHSGVWPRGHVQCEGCGMLAVDDRGACQVCHATAFRAVPGADAEPRAAAAAS